MNCSEPLDWFYDRREDVPAEHREGQERGNIMPTSRAFPGISEQRARSEEDEYNKQIALLRLLPDSVGYETRNIITMDALGELKAKAKKDLTETIKNEQVEAFNHNMLNE